MASTTKRLNDASPLEWDRVREEYLKVIDENINEADMVNKPQHYNNGDIECIKYIKQQLGDCFVDYCEGNVIKYLHRWRYKNGKQDLEKAQWYLNCMVDNYD